MKTVTNRVFLSLVIPVYNEEKRITVGLTHALTYLKKQKYTWEIVLVDDGSQDQTIALAKKLFKHESHQLITHSVNQGKGQAIKDGVLVSRGSYILFSDIDFSTPLTELPKFLKALEKTDSAIGVRRHPNSTVIKHQPRLREFLGHVFTQLTNFIVAPGIYDATCGFKAFRGDVARKLFSLSRIKKWAFDAEILFLARKYHYSITQVPVVWSNNAGTKVHVFQDGCKAFSDLLTVRLGDILGFY